MSPRIQKIRKVLNPPVIKGFKSYGKENKSTPESFVSLLFEEYESLRLCDYDMYNHTDASAIMNVSRPTFTRIYASARKKIAKAFVEGSNIVIEGGKVYFDSSWFHCKNCECYFNNPEMEKPADSCPLCGSLNFTRFEYNYNSTDCEHNNVTVV